ncbi:MAG TPA: histidinol-phosphatase HisJ family protein [Phycisphaerae bacterium]|nr:histidinol-phosphatase HisJ family protein [Phycisphaerae bacterium]
MIPIDYHMHSTHSADGKAPMLEMCEAALARGLAEIAFTEHLDFDRDDPAYGYLDYEAYSASIAEVQAAYAGRLVIRKGLEFDFRRAYGTEVGEVLAAWEFDYLIGSVHSAAGHPIFRLPREAPPDLDMRNLLAEYFAEVEALATSGWCHVIGHFDYVFKQLPDRVGPLRDAWYWQRVEDILACCVAGGVAIEVNTHHILDRGLGLAADVEILRRYRALGGHLVTVGADAHRPTDVAHAFAQAEAALREAGFLEVTGYRQGRPYAVALRA